MTDQAGSADRDAATLPPGVADEITRQTARDIGLLFPGWHVWHSSSSGTWNGRREDEEPSFNPAADDGRMFMVSARDVVGLVAMLERQVQADIAVEFPGCQIGRTDTGRWHAICPEQAASRDGRPLVRVVCHPTVSGLHAALRDLMGQEPER